MAFHPRRMRCFFPDAAKKPCTACPPRCFYENDRPRAPHRVPHIRRVHTANSTQKPRTSCAHLSENCPRFTAEQEWHHPRASLWITAAEPAKWLLFSRTSILYRCSPNLSRDSPSPRGFLFGALIQHKQKKAASGRTETAPCRAKQVRSGNASQSLFDGLGYFSLRRAYRNEAAGLIGGKA